MTHPAQPQIDPTLILIREGFLSGNHYVDLYCSFNPKTNEYSVDGVGLSGTQYDITERCTASEMRSFNMLVNLPGAGYEEAQSRRAEAMSLQRDEHEFAGVGA